MNISKSDKILGMSLLDPKKIMFFSTPLFLESFSNSCLFEPSPIINNLTFIPSLIMKGMALLK